MADLGDAGSSPSAGDAGLTVFVAEESADSSATSVGSSADWPGEASAAVGETSSVTLAHSSRPRSRSVSWRGGVGGLSATWSGRCTHTEDHAHGRACARARAHGGSQPHHTRRIARVATTFARARSLARVATHPPHVAGRDACGLESLRPSVVHELDLPRVKDPRKAALSTIPITRLRQNRERWPTYFTTESSARASCKVMCARRRKLHTTQACHCVSATQS